MSTDPNVQAPTETKEEVAEKNFRNQELYYKNALAKAAQEKESLRLELEKSKSKPKEVEPEEDDYEDNSVRKVEKVLSKWESNFVSKVEKMAEEKAAALLQAQRKEDYLKNTKDFNEVMNETNVGKMFNEYPDIAENLMSMPDTWERQKLVYNTMKSLGVHKPKKEANTQDQIDANRRNPYFSNDGIGNGGYAGGGDYSPAGQKSAYDKIQDLKKQLRL